MAIHKSDIDLVDRFFRNELTGSEKEKYAARLEDDPDLKKLHDEQKLIFEGIAYSARHDIREQLRDIDHNISRTRSPWILYGSVAAAIGVLLLAVVFTYSFYQQWNASRLVEQYFNPPAAFEMPAVRGESPYSDAISAYNSGAYERAEQDLDRLLESGDIAETGIYRLALVKMRLGKFAEAASLLEKLVSQDTGREIGMDARWHLALAYIKTGQAGKAEPHLREIINSSSELSGNAAELLDAL